MEKIITDKESGKKYILQFTRATVAKAEANGFTIAKLGKALETPMTVIPELFYYALLENQPDVTKEESDDILFNKLKGISEKGVAWLANAYSATYTELISDQEESEKNATATVEW